MFVPSLYQPKDPAWLRLVIADYPLAVLVTNGPEVPYATHCPIIVESEPPEGQGVVGATLLGHMNRANPHWSSLTNFVNAQLIFSGPHSYVTPAIYRTTPAAPTWDYISVHLRGTLCVITDFDETLQVVRRTVEVYEEAFGDGWDPQPSLDYFRSIGPAVGAFRIHVDDADGMFKLSQEKELETQDRVLARFAEAPSGTAKDLAEMMRALGIGSGHGTR